MAAVKKKQVELPLIEELVDVGDLRPIEVLMKLNDVIRVVNAQSRHLNRMSDAARNLTQKGHTNE